MISIPQRSSYTMLMVGVFRAPLRHKLCRSNCMSIQTNHKPLVRSLHPLQKYPWALLKGGMQKDSFRWYFQVDWCLIPTFLLLGLNARKSAMGERTHAKLKLTIAIFSARNIAQPFVLSATAVNEWRSHGGDEAKTFFSSRQLENAPISYRTASWILFNFIVVFFFFMLLCYCTRNKHTSASLMLAAAVEC